MEISKQGLKVSKAIQASGYLECSARTGQGVEEAFEFMAETLLRQEYKAHPREQREKRGLVYRLRKSVRTWLRKFT